MTHQKPTFDFGQSERSRGAGAAVTLPLSAVSAAPSAGLAHTAPGMVVSGGKMSSGLLDLPFFVHSVFQQTFLDHPFCATRSKQSCGGENQVRMELKSLVSKHPVNNVNPVWSQLLG